MARCGGYGCKCTINKLEGPFCVGLHQNGLFSVKSMYTTLLAVEAIPYNILILKLKLPLKIKVFMWYLYKRVVLTKDNLARR